MNPMLGDSFDTPVARRRREVTAQVDDLREQALALERQAVSWRQTTLRSVGSYAQVMASVEADDMEKKALRIRRRAAELEHDMERI
ncbi:hypothetical protein [Gordonia amicalis]|uniref:hypothetical protein n=1 Tax=Gordonia amicalis TaxID=89053 RepID=UPI0024B8CCF6|nr:hypothetical protein [Gordonia amicalis]MDJ0454075.1 hypothetical protein [Gordonia amicalis]MDV7077219.1 hypothetical protein [Gordonia amicalis]